MAQWSLSRIESVLLDTIVDGVVLIDRTGHILHFNRACEDIFGYDLEDVVGQNVKVLMPDSYATEHDQYISDYLNTGEEKIIGIGREVSGQRKDGTLIPIYLSVGHSQSDEFHTDIFIGILRDNSKQRALNDELSTQALLLRRSLKREQEINAMHREFTNMAAHEFRTPLAIIDAAAQRIHSKTAANHESDTEIPTRIDSIRNAVKRIGSLIDATLEVARFDADVYDFEPDRIDLVSLVQATVSTLDELSPGRLTLSIKSVDPEAVADKKMMAHVIENLIANGLKYSPENTPVEINLAGNEKIVEFSVSNQGSGIPIHEIDKVFERFYRGESSHGTVGTGLGLYMCRRFVELHRGVIEADSTPEETTRITFRIPRQHVLNR